MHKIVSMANNSERVNERIVKMIIEFDSLPLSFKPSFDRENLLWFYSLVTTQKKYMATDYARVKLSRINITNVWELS